MARKPKPDHIDAERARFRRSGPGRFLQRAPRSKRGPLRPRQQQSTDQSTACGLSDLRLRTYSLIEHFNYQQNDDPSHVTQSPSKPVHLTTISRCELRSKSSTVRLAGSDKDADALSEQRREDPGSRGGELAGGQVELVLGTHQPRLQQAADRVGGVKPAVMLIVNLINERVGL